MIISLVGYMGSGKSHIAKSLGQKLGLKIIDLDKEISLRHHLSVNEIFQTKGEIFFRKQERAILLELLTTQQHCILSLGGGTPCYYNNMETINEFSESVFLRATVSTLNKRLAEKRESRPLIARIDKTDLPEFIAKHLFERNPYYAQAKVIIDTDLLSPHEVADSIIQRLHLRPNHSD